LLLTPTQELLLLNVEPIPGSYYWITPGGAPLAGESDETALRRELAEETGLDLARLGPHVWTRVHSAPDPATGETIEHHERFYWQHVSPFTPQFTPTAAGQERQAFRGFRWWPIQAIRAETRQTFAPRALGALLADLLQSGPPGAPVTIGL
jgi:8-oxo-dGTP pyrophosphatase MutT (NUDIX family)